LKIVELTAYHIRIPLRRAIRHALHRRLETENLLVRCVLENGVEGFGEGVPRDYVTSETVESTLALLQATDLAGQLDRSTDFAQAVTMAERLQLAPVPGDERGCQGNAARCALELAILDAYGRHFQTPLGQVVPLLAPELHQPRDRIQYSCAITSARGYKVRLYGLMMRLAGFHQVKVKVGIPGYDDVKRMGVFRRWVGSRVDLRVDANEAWSPGEVVARVQELEPFRITSVEQPVPHAQVKALREIRRQIRVPIMLDESLCSRSDADAAIADETCDLFNLRLSKCGGFIPTLRLAQLAKQRGLGCQLGCQVGETAVLSAAGRHFATRVGGLRYIEGSYDGYLVREALATRDLTFRPGGWAPALPGGGLGINIDQEAVKRVTLNSVRLL
jgi:L-Ala-D/L-Glu epimerase